MQVIFAHINMLEAIILKNYYLPSKKYKEIIFYSLSSWMYLVPERSIEVL